MTDPRAAHNRHYGVLGAGETAGQSPSTEPVSLPDGAAVWPLVEVRVAERHSARMMLGIGQTEEEAGRLLDAASTNLLAEYRGTRGGAAALLRRLADELDFPLRKVVVTADDLDMRDDRL